MFVYIFFLPPFIVSPRHSIPLAVAFAALKFSIAFGPARQTEWIAGREQD